MAHTRLHRAVSPFDQLLLRILRSGPRSGLDLARLCRMCQPDPRVVRATYLALHRLERRGLLACEWRPVPRRQFNLKHYRVTAAGCRSVTASYAGGVPRSPLTVLIVLSLIWTVDSLGASHDSERPRLTIVVDDGAAIPPADIARARGDVTRIFGAVGVNVDWLLEAPTLDSAIGALQRPSSCLVRAWVTALPPTKTSRSNSVILGIAPQSRRAGGAIVLFYENIQAFAEVLRKSAWSMLAATIAHEVGHVLLPSPAHTSTGIMQPSWHEGASGRLEQDELFFSTQQGTLIRQRVSQCTAVPR
jgi:hypothetical protein